MFTNGALRYPCSEMKIQQLIAIILGEIRFDFVRSSGPGGQNVNKVATAVQLRFDARNSRALSPEVCNRLLKLAGKRASATGEIVIEAKRFRTQKRNREDAVARLLKLIEKAMSPPRLRRKSHPTAASILKRLRDKKRHSMVKKLRTPATADE
jgi:ribosome-associated protein